jgi:hypothetical protein
MCRRELTVSETKVLTALDGCEEPVSLASLRTALNGSVKRPLTTINALVDRGFVNRSETSGEDGKTALYFSLTPKAVGRLNR